MKIAHLATGAAVAAALHITNAQTASMDTADTTSLLSAYLPENYREVSRRNIRLDGGEAILQRWQPAAHTQTTYGGEHFSILYNHHQIKGFTDMRAIHAHGELPDKASAQAAADAFLREYGADLLTDREIHWIDRHDETIRVNGETLTLRGMKVKMRNRSDGRWFWVIIASNGQPIVFERDIVWINMPGHRQTEKWLHDNWLMQQETDK